MDLQRGEGWFVFLCIILYQVISRNWKGNRVFFPLPGTPATIFSPFSWDFRAKLRDSSFSKYSFLYRGRRQRVLVGLRLTEAAWAHQPRGGPLALTLPVRTRGDPAAESPGRRRGHAG